MIIYELSDAIISNILFQHKQTVLNDTNLLTTNFDNHTEGAKRGQNLNTSNLFTGDFSKITDLHFIKGAYFDREYFKRLYPNINIRYKPELAQVIAFDERSIFENDSKSYTVYKTACGIYFSNTRNLSTIAMAVSPTCTSTKQRYGKLVGLGKDSKIIGTILNSLASGTYAVVNLIEKNPYFDLLASLNKPYIHISTIVNCTDSSARQNTLTLEECLTYFNQITSDNIEASSTAMDAVLMYNPQKYLPLMLIMYSFYKPMRPSKKQILFSSTNGQHLIYNPRYGGLDQYIGLITSINQKCGELEPKYPNTDWDIVRKFALSQEVYKRFIKLGPTNEATCQVHDILFEIKNGILAEPIEKTPENVPNIMEAFGV